MNTNIAMEYLILMNVSGLSELGYAFEKSDSVGQGICYLLLIFSAGVWFVIVERIITLCTALKSSRAFLQRFQEAGNLFELQKYARESKSPAGAVYLDAVRRFKSFDAVRPGNICRGLTEKEVGLLRTTMERSVDKQMLALEKFTLALASAVSGCPFLGLFGTVWGITVAFTKLAQTGQPDVRTLAPGVSGALLTTVVALVVAIPSMLGNNMIVALLRTIGTHLDDVVEEIAARFQVEFMQDDATDVSNESPSS